jgi:hypothetical protein
MERIKRMRGPYKQLDEEINMAERERQEAREWAQTLLFVSGAAAVLMACVWLGGAF